MPKKLWRIFHGPSRKSTTTHLVTGSIMSANRQYDFIFAELGKPFTRDGEVKVLEKKPGKPKYITARTVMNRLDEVLGPANWWDEYTNITGDSAICRLTIRLPDGQELTKCDAGGSAGMTDQGDDDKSIISDAFKRAAVKFGVGRYLRGDGVPDLASRADEQSALVESGATHESGTQVPVNEATQEATASSQAGSEPESKGLNGNPFQAGKTFWNDVLDGVSRANAEWFRSNPDLAGNPDSDQVVTTDAVVMKLAWLTFEQRVQPVAPDAKEGPDGKPMTMSRWAAVLNKVARKSPEMHEWLKGHMDHFIGEQLAVARKLKKRGVSGPRK
jgi:hypothetical protein